MYAGPASQILKCFGRCEEGAEQRGINLRHVETAASGGLVLCSQCLRLANQRATHARRDELSAAGKPTKCQNRKQAPRVLLANTTSGLARTDAARLLGDDLERALEQLREDGIVLVSGSPGYSCSFRLASVVCIRGFKDCCVSVLPALQFSKDIGRFQNPDPSKWAAVSVRVEDFWTG